MFGDIYRGKCVLVTGHTGFKGSWICSWLVHLGANVHGVSIGIPTTPSLFGSIGLEPRIHHHILDIRDGEALGDLIKRINPDFVFHLAAQPIVSASYLDPGTTFTTNVMGTFNVLNGIRLLEKPIVGIVITSDKCYENLEWTWGYRENDNLGGKDPYSASKASAEVVFNAMYHSFFKTTKHQRVITVRAGNVIGGGDWAKDRVVPDAVRAWSKKDAVKVRNPKATRPWQHVLEPISGYLRAGQSLAASPNLNGEAYNFGPASDQTFSVMELLIRLLEIWDNGIGIESGINSDSSPTFHEAGLLKLNCDKALHDLQWKSVLTFDQTTRMTANWYKEYYLDSKADLFEFTRMQIEEYFEVAKKNNLAWTI